MLPPLRQACSESALPQLIFFGFCSDRKRFDAIDVSVETAVCHILLGEVDAAAAALGLTGSASRSPDPGIKQFVLVQSRPRG